MILAASRSTFPVALQRDVQPQILARARLRATNLVIWKSRLGAIQVWEDRCPHRSIRLSAGRNLGDCVQCAYHGWTFGADGSVRDVPGRIDGLAAGLDDTVGVNTVNSIAAHGIVWASVDGEAVAPRGFTPGDTDILLRPVNVDLPSDLLLEACGELEDMVLMVTPCDDRTSMIYGYAARPPDTLELDVLQSCNHRLNALRRQLEEGAQP